MSVNTWNAENQELEKLAGNANINDGAISEDSTWSSKKISDSLEDKADKGDVEKLIPKAWQTDVSNVAVNLPWGNAYLSNKITVTPPAEYDLLRAKSCVCTFNCRGGGEAILIINNVSDVAIQFSLLRMTPSTEISGRLYVTFFYPTT